MNLLEKKRVFSNFIKGYLIVFAQGEETTRFFNLCEYNGIHLTNLRREKNGFLFQLRASDFLLLRQIRRKTKVSLKIEQKLGLPFLCRMIRKHKVLMCSLFLFFAIPLFLSKFIWRVDFEGCYYHTPEQLWVFLKEQNINIGTYKGNFEGALLEKKIRSRYTDIGWVSVEIIGTKMCIRIKENINSNPEKQKQYDGLENEYKNEFGHIVAEYDGIVRSLVVRNGTAKVNIGDVVQKGDILVQGLVEITGDDKTVIKKEPVLAKADIALECSISYQDEFCMKYTEKVLTGNTKNGVEVFAFGRKIFSYIPSISYKKYDIINKIGQLYVWDDYCLPIYKNTLQYTEYEFENKTYSKERALDIARQNAKEYLSSLKGEYIPEASEIKTVFEHGFCVTKGQIRVLLPAWTYREIDPMEWRITTDEHSGNEN